MQAWRNTMVNYERAKARIMVLEAENRELKKENALLKEKVAKLEADNLEMKAQIAELREWVFKRKKHKKDEYDSTPSSGSGVAGGASRSSASYKRELPKQEDITQRKRWLLTQDLCTCGSHIEKRIFQKSKLLYI